MKFCYEGGVYEPNSILLGMSFCKKASSKPSCARCTQTLQPIGACMVHQKLVFSSSFHVCIVFVFPFPSLVENMVKRSAIVFPLWFFWPPCSAVAKQLQIYFSWLTKWHSRYFGARNIPMESFWKYLSNGISHAPKHSNLQLQNEK